MKLRFYARAEHVVHYPAPRQAGQIHNYVGRQFVPHEDDRVARETRVAGQNRATKEPFELESGSQEAEILSLYALQGGLWCADAETAAAVGVAFVPVTYDEKAFEFYPTPDAAPAKPSKPTAQPE